MYRPNIYNMPGNNSTFHNNFRPPFVPPPPVPPPFFIPPACSEESQDLEFIKKIEERIPAAPKPIIKPKLSISDIREELREIIVAVNTLKTKEIYLRKNIITLSDEEWNIILNEVKEIQLQVKMVISHIKSPLLDDLRKRLAERAAKRSRMRRLRKEIQKEMEEKKKESQETSRKIDENLQKIKDEIIKAEKEREAKLEADMVLKEVLRRKNDAKKCLIKLEALDKLRKARQNTARGRGEKVLESSNAEFNSTIDKLKSLWTRKLSNYENEEADLHTQLKEDSAQTDTNGTETEVANHLNEWMDVIFGGQMPQADFGGNVSNFLAVRSQWDQYIADAEGTTMPVGWVPPD